MAKRDAKKRAHGDGPYREAPLTPPPEKKPWWLWALLASAALLALVFNLSGEDDPEAEPTLADVPPMLLDAVAVFPTGGEVCYSWQQAPLTANCSYSEYTGMGTAIHDGSVESVARM